MIIKPSSKMQRGCFGLLVFVILIFYAIANDLLFWSYALPSRERAEHVKYLYLNNNRLHKVKSVNCREAEFEASLSADMAPTPCLRGYLVDVKPYIILSIVKRSSYSEWPIIDPAKITLTDSEGHQFKVVGFWPEGETANTEQAAYRFEIDAIDFNRRVKYQKYSNWEGMYQGEGWGPDERYTLSLRLPFEYKKESCVIEINRIAAFYDFETRKPDCARSLVRKGDLLFFDERDVEGVMNSEDAAP